MIDYILEGTLRLKENKRRRVRDDFIRYARGGDIGGIRSLLASGYRLDTFKSVLILSAGDPSISPFIFNYLLDHAMTKHRLYPETNSKMLHGILNSSVLGNYNYDKFEIYVHTWGLQYTRDMMHHIERITSSRDYLVLESVYHRYIERYDGSS